MMRVYTYIMSPKPCLCTSLREAALALTELYDRALEPSGLKITMFRLLRRLKNAGPSTISEFAAVVNLDRSTLGRNLKVLERDGLVTLTCGKDERSKVIHLTKKAEEGIETATPYWEKTQQQIRDIVDEETEIRLNQLTEFNKVSKDQSK